MKSVRSRETRVLGNTAVRTTNLASHGKQTKATEKNDKGYGPGNSMESNYAKYYWNSRSVIIRDLLPVQSNSKRFLMTLVVVSFCFLCSTSRILQSFTLDGQQTPTLERETEKRSHVWSMRNSQNMSTWERSARSDIFRQPRNKAPQATQEIKTKTKCF